MRPEPTAIPKETTVAKDYIDIGPCPADEPCVQLGDSDYERRARTECAAFIREIRHAVGDEPTGALLAVKGNPHDFGRYYEVVCYFDDENNLSLAYALECERRAPLRWTEVGKTYLKEHSTLVETIARELGIEPNEVEL
jgi:hypothetical protein